MDRVEGAGMNLAAGALAAHAVGLQVAAHNVANVSTADFRPQVATYATGPNGVGVALQSVRKQEPAMGSLATAEAGVASPAGVSGTDLAREMTHMAATQRGFEANAAVIRATDELTGSLLNLIA